MNQDKSKKRE